jgi:hypothetical protein
MIFFLQRDFLVLAPSLDISQLNTVSDYTRDNLSPLTPISDDEDYAFQEVVINTNFNPYLEENHKFPCGRSEEERLHFTKESRESVEEHALTPSTLEELTSLVF